jgi:hypothetical protein
MKTNVRIFLALLASSVLPAAVTSQDVVRVLASAPLRFEQDPHGDSGSFVSRGLHHAFSFSQHKISFNTGGRPIHVRFDGARPDAHLEGIDALRSTTSTILGNNRTQWRTGILNFNRLQERGLYRGIDLVYYGSAGELEYDLIVDPGADPRKVRLRFSGAVPSLDTNGNLAAGFVLKRPSAYQIAANGSRIPVRSSYMKHADGTYGFALGAYDHKRQLVIDPTLTLSAYLAGSGDEIARAIGHDARGFIYVAGTTSSTDFPVAGDSEQSGQAGSADIFLVKIDPNAPAGSQIVYSTYFGGANADVLNDMVVAPSGVVYMVGSTSSTDFPMANPAQSAISGTSDAFVICLDPSRSGSAGLLYSSYLGGAGDETGNGIAVNSAGRIFVTGSTNSDDFPVIAGFQTSRGGSQDAFFASIDPAQSNQSSLVYSSYLGGGGWDTGRSVAAASDGTAWVVGGTFSYDLPVTSSAYQSTNQVGGDAFVVQVNPAAFGTASLSYATYLGGSGEDEAKKVTVDSAGRVIVAGYTLSTNFPLTPNALQTQYGGNADAFVSIFNSKNLAAAPASQLLYSTYFGGSDGEVPYDVKEDAAGNIYVTGYTMSADLAVSGNALQRARASGVNAFVLKFNPSRSGADAVDYSSYVGAEGQQIGYGIDFDANGNIYLAGYASGAIFDQTAGAPKIDGTYNIDAFVMGFSPCSIDVSSRSEQFPAQGGSDIITITASRGCTWIASSSLDWVTVSPTAGSLNGAVRITVAPNNTGAARTGTISIAGVQFLVGQDR